MGNTDSEQTKRKKHHIFDKENPVNHFLYIMGSLILANVFFIICSIPVITAGASLTALNRVCYAIMEETDVRVTKTFFRTFVQNILDATLVWIIIVGLLSMFGFGVYWFVTNGNSAGYVAGTAVCAVGIICTMIEFTYYFMILSRYRNPVLTQIKNAFLIGFVNLGWTIVIWAVWLAVIAVFAFFSGAIIYFGWIWLMIGFSLIVYGSSFIYRKIFHKFETHEED